MTVKSPEAVFTQFLLLQADAPRDVSDLEAVRQLGLTPSDFVTLRRSIPGLVSQEWATEFLCPDCGSRISLPRGIKNAYCETCTKVWRKNQFPKKVYTLDRRSAEEYLVARMAKELANSGLHVKTESDPQRLLTSFESVDIGIGLHARAAKLKDYYALRGSLKDPANSVVALLAPYFDNVLQYYAQNTPGALLIDTMGWLAGSISLTSGLQDHVRQVSLSNRLSRSIGRQFEELKVADDIGEQLHDLLRNLPLLSLQMLSGSASMLGNRFQRDVISALNVFTPFKVSPIGGKNQEDGILHFYFPGKRARWYPVGIKSFEGDPTSKPYFRVRDAGEQVRKYARAYLQEESIVRELDVPAYLLVAHDFDLDLRETSEQTGAFQADVGIPLKLFPVKTILALIRGFAELRPDDVPNEYLVEFVDDSGPYLSPAGAERLMERIRGLQAKAKQDPRIVRVRDRLREGHA